MRWLACILAAAWLSACADEQSTKRPRGDPPLPAAAEIVFDQAELSSFGDYVSRYMIIVVPGSSPDGATRRFRAILEEEAWKLERGVGRHQTGGVSPDGKDYISFAAPAETVDDVDIRQLSVPADFQSRLRLAVRRREPAVAIILQPI